MNAGDSSASVQARPPEPAQGRARGILRIFEAAPGEASRVPLTLWTQRSRTARGAGSGLPQRRSVPGKIEPASVRWGVASGRQARQQPQPAAEGGVNDRRCHLRRRVRGVVKGGGRNLQARSTPPPGTGRCGCRGLIDPHGPPTLLALALPPLTETLHPLRGERQDRRWLSSGRRAVFSRPGSRGHRRLPARELAPESAAAFPAPAGSGPDGRGCA
jgi:hypothetical protein